MPDEQFDPNDDQDGIFIMSFEDWKDNFSTLFINNDFPDHWSGVRFKSGWSRSACGGLPNKYEKSVLERYAQNPQFLVKPTVDCEMMYSLTQPGGRLP